MAGACLAALLLLVTLPAGALRTPQPVIGYGRRAQRTTFPERSDSKKALRVHKLQEVARTTQDERQQWQQAATSSAPPTRREIFGSVNDKLHDAMKSVAK